MDLSGDGRLTKKDGTLADFLPKTLTFWWCWHWGLEHPFGANMGCAKAPFTGSVILKQLLGWICFLVVVVGDLVWKKNRSTHWLFIIVDGKSEGKPCTFRGALLFGNYDHKHDWNLRIRCWIWFYCYVLPTFIQDRTQWVAAVSATRCSDWRGISEQPCWEVICVRSLLATEEMDINAPPDVLSVLDDGVDRKLRLVNTLMTGGMECQ